MTHGILLIDKPAGPTSHDVVEVVRHAFGIRKVGHMGTLDPLATGLLLIGIGEGTKLTPFLSGLDKTYTCTARLGARSSTYDSMGEIEDIGDPGCVERGRIEATLGDFRGTIEQLPPPFSAVKVKGRPLYKYARKGEAVERKSRRVRVEALEMVAWTPPDLALRMRVGSGTYVRSIVHDLGEKLGVGAHVTRLRRTAIGAFCVEDAVAVSVDGAIEGDAERAMRTLADGLAHMARVNVSEPHAAAVRSGNSVVAERLNPPPPASLGPDEICALVDGDGHLLAVARCVAGREPVQLPTGEARRGDRILKPVRVFHDE